VGKAFGVTNRFRGYKGESHGNCDRSCETAQIRVARRSPAYWRVTIDNPPIDVMGPEMMVREFQEVIGTLEGDEHVRVVVFDSAVQDYFLNHSDFTVSRT
jgi:enoyl-CoA hydratase/carnithine racemase